MRHLSTTSIRCAVALEIACCVALAQGPVLTVDAGHPGAKISPMLYGVFFEEINHSGDGGLYAEMVRNRTFADKFPSAWSVRSSGAAHATMELETDRPLNAQNPRSLRLNIAGADKNSPVAVVNEGFWGMGVKKGEKYNLSFFARAGANFKGGIEARIEGASGKVYGSGKIGGIAGGWKRFTASLESSETDSKAHLSLVVSAPGTLWFNVVSLFPATTWKNRPNGMRPDLASMLVDLKPAFLRFPGGCFVEGGNFLRNAFRWKTTIGDIAERPGHLNDIWGYNVTDGLGFHEYLQLAEDLGAEPLYDVNVGMSHREATPIESMNEWVQEALDGIEYANGPVTGKWGALRARNGHPASFHLKYVEIGNENNGPRYQERYPILYKAIKERYPDIVTIANSVVTTAPMDILDNHIYSSPERLRSVANTYDNYDRKGPKVFEGEYANNRDSGKGNLKAALSEAAFMMGFERNADVVVMASYAPLLYNVNDARWPVNLIGFDSTRHFGIPSYWVQRMFAENRGDVVLPAKMDAEKVRTPLVMERGSIGLGTMNGQAEFKDVKVTQGEKVLYASDFAKGVTEWRSGRGGQWSVQDGVYRQQGSDAMARATTGDANWADYTLSLKARKTGGQGFQVSFRARDFGTSLMLNVGGTPGVLASVDRMANGTRTRLTPAAAGEVETGRWYDVKIDVQGPRVQCFLDGKLVIDIPNVNGEIVLPMMESVVSRVERTGEIVVKVVNFANQPQKTSVRLDGAAGVSSNGTETVLTSASVEDENTLDQPTKVAPVSRSVSGLGPQFTYTFAPNSLTILRLKTATK